MKSITKRRIRYRLWLINVRKVEWIDSNTFLWTHLKKRDDDE